MDLTESDHPHLVDIRKLSSTQLKIDAKSAIVQRNDGTVYFAGGFDDTRNRSHNYVGLAIIQLYVYDPIEGNMSQMADMAAARSSHGACLNGKYIYVLGGRNEAGVPMKTFERYDSSINVWEKLPDCQVAVIRPLLVTLNDKYIFKFGGIGADEHPCNVIERFDIGLSQWTTVNYHVREDSQILKSSGFALHPMMTGVQISYNSVLVLREFIRYSADMIII